MDAARFLSCVSFSKRTERRRSAREARVGEHATAAVAGALLLEMHNLGHRLTLGIESARMRRVGARLAMPAPEKKHGHVSALETRYQRERCGGWHATR